MKLLNVLTLAEARTRLSGYIRQIPRKKITVPLSEADGHILAEDIRAPFSVPEFKRSTVDGYAVIATDTHGASDTIPVFLEATEQVKIGEKPLHPVTNGQCAYVPTGGMIPDGANSMVMVEYCEAFSASDIAVSQSVAAGNHVIFPGDDMEKGALALPKETLLRFQEIGALAAMGITSVSVYAPYTATILSTGNELISPGDIRSECKIYDSNTYALSVQARHANLKIMHQYLMPDDKSKLMQALSASMADSDLVIISGGSSQGKQDMTETLFQEITDNGVYAHGLALKPGKPTILAWDEASRTALIGLPGHPVAASMVFELLISQALRQPLAAQPGIPANLSVNIPTSPGRETCIPVKLVHSGGTLLATPILGQSGLWSPLAQADGYILIDKNKEGLQANEPVIVYTFER